MQDMSRLDKLESLAQQIIEGAFNGARNRTKTKEALIVTAPQAAQRWILKLGRWSIRLGQPVINIGRAPDNDVVLGDASVMPHHAQLRWREGRYYLYPPAAPANGPVQQHPLSAGDVLRIGKIELTVELDG